MTLTPDVGDDIFRGLTNENIETIRNYINDSMTATTFSDRENRKFNREIITSEIIYYWMISLNIPVEFEIWHLNSLITLIRVCNVKNQPPKKMSKNEVLNHYLALNASRRKKFK